MNYPISKQLAAEAIGTFCLVFAGTGAMVVNDVSGGAITHVGIAVTFGLVVMSMIYALGDISGAHFNPAVTVGFMAARRMPLKVGGLFVLSQLLGALLASVSLRVLFPSHELLGATLPSGVVEQSFTFEVMLTFFLMFVILGVSTGAKEKGITAGLAIGATVMLAAMFGGPISGASMNPARSIGPAVAAAQFSFLWIYIAAPLLGAIIAVVACRCVRENGCCT
ncbi:MAG: aquaporin [Symploca sp. SIO2G7]|nr:aquaporin [Symploca sp. SIO2G7]